MKKRGRRKGFKRYRKLFEHKGYEIIQDKHNLILKPINSSKEAEYFSSLKGALEALYNKLLLKRISEGDKKDLENIKASFREIKEEFSERFEITKGTINPNWS